ncbi:MAG TPA: DUF2283 domain-containing protein [Acidilobales archaeon]|nr:MAG: hypothetical protein B6U85_06755 [Desulfurococcales archaeon ex4484_42]HDD26855.1 DUF2283 domain-containing protein [Acidilobales archaeon]
MSERRYEVATLDKIWFEYDKQNDILYINFGYDIEDADESILTEDNIVIRIKDGKVVSLTVFDFLKRISVEF